MTTVKVDGQRPEPSIIARAAAILRAGGLVSFPTETVYGLGANALDAEAVGRIFAAKGRPAFNPLIVHCADRDSARAFARVWPESAERLAAAFWPGPLTLVLPRTDEIPDVVTAGLSTVALRVPDHPVAAALLRESGVPIAAPSANRSMELSPTRAEHVSRGLGGRVDLMLDAGPTPVGIESTVIDLSGATAVLLRPGTLAADRIEAILGSRLGDVVPSVGDTPRSPGMLERHYAPAGRLVVIDGAERLAALASEHAGSGERVGALVFPGDSPAIANDVIEMPAEPSRYAAALYDALHDLDGRGCGLILVRAVPDGPAWAGIRDRLRRAATTV